MPIGELWVAHPLFPWIMIILAWWVLCSTVVIARNYVLIRRLERHNKLLQKMVAEGVRLAKQTAAIESRIPISKSIEHTEERTSELCSEQNGIRIEEPEAAAIEEAVENGDDFTVAENEDKERAGARST